MSEGGVPSLSNAFFHPSAHQSPPVSIPREWGVSLSSLLICIPVLLISASVRLLICIPVDRVIIVLIPSLLGPGILIRILISSSGMGVEVGLSLDVIRTLLMVLILLMLLIFPVPIPGELRFELVVSAAH